MMRRISLVLALIAGLLIGACSDSGGDVESQGIDPSDPCVPGVGEAGAPGVTLQDAQTGIASGEGTAMNTLDESGNPITSSMRPAMAGNSCGGAGLIYFDPDSGKLRYREISNANTAAEAVDDNVSFDRGNLALLYDNACTAMIVSDNSSGGLLLYVRQSEGNWTDMFIEATLPGDGGNLNLFAAKVAPDGKRVIFAHYQSGETTMGVMWVNTGDAAAGWIQMQFTLPIQGEIYDYALAPGHGLPDGMLFAVYPAVNTYPCDPCDNDLYFAEIGEGSRWNEAVVQESKWGDPDDQFADQAKIAVAKSGEPVVVATFQARVITGSLKESQLRVYSRKDGAWCFETAADKQDGYAGDDGTSFTGQAPQIAIDDAGHIAVLFFDQTQWHDGTGANGIVGQPRLALRTADQWSLTTLYAQPGQVDSPNALNGFRFGDIALSPDGSTAYMAGAAFVWQTNSIYNSTDLPISYDIVVRKADIAWP